MWDQVAKEKCGSEKAFHELLPVNAAEMDCLVFAGETLLDVPEMELPAMKSLPPWERM